MPPYTITPEILNRVATISEAIEGKILSDGLIEMTIPGQPNSRLTGKGRQCL